VSDTTYIELYPDIRPLPEGMEIFEFPSPVSLTPLAHLSIAPTEPYTLVPRTSLTLAQLTKLTKSSFKGYSELYPVEEMTRFPFILVRRSFLLISERPTINIVPPPDPQILPPSDEGAVFEQSIEDWETEDIVLVIKPSQRPLDPKKEKPHTRIPRKSQKQIDLEIIQYELDHPRQFDPHVSLKSFNKARLKQINKLSII
jgi:hypothetical protein